MYLVATCYYSIFVCFNLTNVVILRFFDGFSSIRNVRSRFPLLPITAVGQQRKSTQQEQTNNNNTVLLLASRLDKSALPLNLSKGIKL